MQQTKTTSHLRLPHAPQWLDHIPAPLLAGGLILLIAAGISTINHRPGPSAAAVPTPSLPIIVIQKEPAAPLPMAMPTPAQQLAAAPVGNVTRKAIVVYGAADLASAIGAVEPGRAFTPVAHFGADWMIVDMAGSGRVYVQVADLYDLPAGLLDLKPAAPAQVIVQPVYVNQPAQPAPAVEQPYQVDNQPAQPPEPPQQPVAPGREVVPVGAPQAPPTAAPVDIVEAARPLPNDSEVEAEWARQQQRSENCIGSGEHETCVP